MILIVFLIGMLGLSLNVQKVEADETIYIMPDGSVSPSTAPIQAEGDIFTLVDNFHITLYYDGIVIERNNTILDGASHVLVGPNIPESDFTAGVRVSSGTNNVTIRHMEIEDFAYGIWLQPPDNTVYENNLTSNRYGIHLESSSHNIITGNAIYGNTIAGIELYNSSDNNATLNNIYDGVSISRSLHNNWDNGVSEGNYWSDYTGVDMKSGPYQNETGSDGIGDTPYVIDATNTDHYPLMGTFQSFNVSVSELPIQFEEVDIISNSTIREVDYLWADDVHSPTGLDWWLHLSGFVGQNGTVGFCRVTFPNDMLYSSSYTIGTIHMYIWDSNFTASRVLSSNGTHTTLYFTYDLPTPDWGLVILPEFPSIQAAMFFMLLTLLAVIIYKKKGVKTSQS
jgi:parallel beta-helix repeat protein